MINMPYDDIIKRIKEEKKISDEVLNSKIRKKMDQLSGLISKEGAAYIIANDLGVKLIQTNGMIKINNLVSGQRNIETAGKVMRIFDLIEFEKEDRKGKVRSFILADETGQTRITAWHDQTQLLTKIKEGDTIKLTNGFVKNNQGQNEVHLNDRSKVIIDPEGIEIKDVKEFKRPEFVRKKISDLQEDDQNIEVFGTIVQVFDPRYFEQCPECRKKPSLAEGDFVCEQHGKITPLYGYVTNVVLDDGSDSIRAVTFKEQMQQLFKKSDEELLSYRSSIEKFEKLKTDLLGEQVLVAGRVIKNEMFERLELRASKVITDIDPEKEIQKLQVETKTPESQTSTEAPVVKKEETAEVKPETSGQVASETELKKDEVVPETEKPEQAVEKPQVQSVEPSKTESTPIKESETTEVEKDEEKLVDLDKSTDDDEKTKEILDTDKEKEKLPSIDDL